MSTTRIIIIVVLLVVGAHLLLYAWLQRRIFGAKRELEERDRDGQ
jgi:hypothetical protein